MILRSLDRVPDPLRRAMQRRGFSDLTAVQEAALDANGAKRDLQISSQTGSGKTIALGLVTSPTLLAEAGDAASGTTVLVIVPTRELAAQVSKELEWLYAEVSRVTFDSVTGGTQVWRERQRLKNRPSVLVGTPGRLVDHLQSGALRLDTVRHLVLDEADQMLDMGFREELETILDATPAERRTHMVSATFPQGILRLAERYQSDPLHIQGTQLGEANADIEHIACMVDDRDRYAALVNLLILGEGERTLLFVATRAETSQLAEKLTADGFSALPLSGELAQAQRDRTLAAFKQGSANILVATDVASRGLDVPDVGTVIHGAPPLDGQIYTHRSGRTGRAGQQGRSVMLVTRQTERRVRSLLRVAQIEAEWRDAPDAEHVTRRIAKQQRRATWELVSEAEVPSEERLEEAQRLLEDRDPATVIATLLEATRQPEGGPKPRKVGGRPPETRRYAEPSGRPGRHGHAGPRNGARAGSHGGAHNSARGTIFFINWGLSAGATPKRILAHICRRGRVNGPQVGAIRLQPHGSTFEIHPSVVGEFEERARVRDNRDPHLRIERARY